MRRGLYDEWIIKDRFLRRWRFWLEPRVLSPTSTPSSPTESVDNALAHLLHHAFDDFRARHDDIARDLIGIYDELTGSRLGAAVPRPTQDREGTLRGFNHRAKRVLGDAAKAGVLKWERYESPWPFPEKDEKQEPSNPAAPPPSEDEERYIRVRFDPPEELRFELRIGQEVVTGVLSPGQILEHRVLPGILSAFVDTWPSSVESKDDAGDARTTWELDIAPMPDPQSVAGAQARLNNMGFISGLVDGDLGLVTQSAVRSFQEKLGLANADGELDGDMHGEITKSYGA